MRTCARCLIEKDESEFGRDRPKPDGLSIYCKQCGAAKTAAWRVANPDKVKAYVKNRYANHPDPEKRKKDLARWKSNHPDRNKMQVRNANFKKHYGIDVKTYELMLHAQGNVCKICGSTDGKTLQVDHDHTTGRVRGYCVVHVILGLVVLETMWVDCLVRLNT